MQEQKYGGYCSNVNCWQKLQKSKCVLCDAQIVVQASWIPEFIYKFFY